MADLPAEAAITPDPAVQARRRRVRLIRLLQIGHVVVLAILLLLFLVYAVQTDLQPVSRWVAGTPVETFCRRLAPFIWEQQQRLKVTVKDSVLLADEKAKARQILARMETIRPTHVVITRDQRQLFGRLREEGDGYAMQVFDGRAFETVRLAGDDIVWRKAIVFPDGVLTAGDLRFLIRHDDLNAYFLAPYLFVTQGSFADVQPLYQALSTLGDQFAQALGPVCDTRDESTTIRVCQLPDEASFQKEVQSREAMYLVNSLGFFSETDQTLYLTDGDWSAAGPEARQLALIRHEGTHQLIAALGIVPSRSEAPFWLQEGLAQYCESDPIGKRDEERLAMLRAAAGSGQLLPWGDLFRLQTAHLDELGDAEVRLAYAQSWLVVYHLMQRGGRPTFFRYLLALKHPDEALSASDPEIVLVNSLQIAASKLYADLDTEITGSGADAR